MINFVQIDSLISEYSENLLPAAAVFDENSSISYFGSGVVSLSSSVSYEADKSINLFCNTNAFSTSPIVFNFGNDLNKVVPKTGNYIFSLKLYNGTVSTNSLTVDVQVNLYVNTIFTESFVCSFDTGTFSRNSWATFAQSFALTAGDDVNFTFEFNAPTSPEPNPNVSLNFDGLKLEFDDRNLGIPSVYSLPVAKNNIPTNFVIVSQLSDLPTPVANIITLKPNTTYKFTNVIDMLANRFVLGAGTVLQGTSSQNSGTINGGSPLITTNNSLDINNFSINGNAQVFSVNSGGITDNVFINNTTIINCATLGTIANVASVIFQACSLSNNGVLNFDGTIGTIAADNALFIPSATNTCLRILSTATITRRIRIESSSFIIDGTSTGIDVSTSATIPDERYILFNVNFSGSSSTYLSGITNTSNKALFSGCVGINNTLVIGQMYMQSNATATVIAAPSTFVKIAGTTIAGELSKYLHTTGRLTNDAIIPRKFLVQCVVSFTSGNNQVCEFGFYDSTIAGVRVPSRVIQTTSGAGVAENVVLFAIINQDQGDYLEVWCANNTSATNITVNSLNVIISQI